MNLRALKSDEEINAVPMDKPVLVELPSGFDLGDDVAEREEQDTEKSDAKNEDGAEILKRRLDEEIAARAASDELAKKAEREAAESLRKAVERDEQLRRERARSAALETDIIDGGLRSAQAERDSAQAAFKAAFENGDAEAMAKAQSRIGRAEARILRFEEGAAEAAERREAPQQELPQRHAIDPMAAIEANPQLLPQEKKWLKDHPDSVIDPARNNELGVGYQRAVAKGLVRGTPAYFAYLEEFMGYAKPGSDNANPSNPQRESNVSAPPSRNERGGDGRPAPNRVTLTPEERDIAKSLGVSEIEYARQKVAMEAARKADPERFR